MIEIERWDSKNLGELTEEKMRAKLRSEGFSALVRQVYPVRTSFREHQQPNDRKYAVLDGQLVVNVDGEPFILQAGDSLKVPAHTKRSAQVLGERDVVILEGSFRGEMET